MVPTLASSLVQVFLPFLLPAWGFSSKFLQPSGSSFFQISSAGPSNNSSSSHYVPGQRVCIKLREMLEQCDDGWRALDQLENHGDRSLFDDYNFPGGYGPNDRGCPSDLQPFGAEFAAYGLPIPGTDIPWAADIPRDEINLGPVAYEYWYPFGRFLCGTVLGKVPASEHLPLRVNVQLDAGYVVPDYFNNDFDEGPFAVLRAEVDPAYVTPVLDKLYTVDFKEGEDGPIKDISSATTGETVLTTALRNLYFGEEAITVAEAREVLQHSLNGAGHCADVKLMSRSGSVL